MTNDLFVVVMAGGTGTRFWPHSRQGNPKQFLDVLGTGKSLLQMTCDRFAPLAPLDQMMIVSNERYADILKEQFPDMSADQLLLEPSKRNTAPCVAYAAYKLREKNPDAVMVITPSDHAIFQEKKFLDTIQTAVEEARIKNELLTIGIPPTHPETGYGYIQYIESNTPTQKVKTFTEKPEKELAQKFLDSGDFVWNAGIFVWSVRSIIEAFVIHDPEMAELFEAGRNHFYHAGEEKFIRDTYAQCRNISIDYAIMEKADNVCMVLGDFSWSDLGSWNALYELREKDEYGNVIDGEVIVYDSSNNYVKLADGKIAILEDVHDYLIADFKDVLLICRKDDGSRFRSYVKEVKERYPDRV